MKFSVDLLKALYGISEESDLQAYLRRRLHDPFFKKAYERFLSVPPPAKSTDEKGGEDNVE